MAIYIKIKKTLKKTENILPENDRTFPDAGFSLSSVYAISYAMCKKALKIAYWRCAGKQVFLSFTGCCRAGRQLPQVLFARLI
ncbi:hypothetical protein C7N43_27495 [Sphingobacteriales bacterium UPWRP_1]|nr:hypothetical protein BVG80_04975 [Sphingobacteriales bacterium TSM_CSM]PSJ73748.1 hypothetical protein C7N43_27495 [Sphingobacteriales bacterium UPWRP_1]